MLESDTFSGNVLKKEWVKDRLAIEEALAEISRIFLSPDCADLDHVMEILGKAASVNRTYIVRFSDDTEKVHFANEWCDRPDAFSLKNRNLDNASLFPPSFTNKLVFNEVLMIPDVDALPPEYTREKEMLQSRDVSSILVIPVSLSSGLLTGAIGFENTRECREWLGEEVQTLKVISGMIRIYWERCEIFNALRISEEKYRELYEEVKKTEAVYRSLINSSADAIVMSGMDGEILYVNPSFVSLFGWSIDEMNLDTTSFIPAAEKYFYKRLVEDTAKKGTQCRNHETRRRTKDGRSIDVSLSVSRYDDHEGMPAGMLYIYRDISERKQLEAQLVQAQKMEAVGTLAGGIAHDFNNNLQGIFTSIEIMLMGKDKDHPDYEKLKTIERSAERASNLTKRLLVFGRKMENRFEPVDLNNEVRQVADILERTIPKMISIFLDLDQGIRMINADPGQLEQIMMNLGVNARDAMPDGGMLSFKSEEIFLDDKYCSAHPSSKKGDYVLLSVSDNGCGMSKEVLNHIFEPFFTTKKKGKGTGLGLSMVYGIVKDHGGSIICESAPGKGTTFKIFFPVAEFTDKKESEIEPERSIIGNNKTILLVDDEETNRDLGKEILEGFGYRTITAVDGESAIDCYMKNKDSIDLIVLDLIMPGMGGSICLEKIIRFDPDAKVIIASGFTSDKPMSDTLKKDAKDFITKPYNMKKMHEVIQRVLS
ncbi:MAG: PAS domain S-box protein [Deltaproteobacteria bacterium]|nr:PAS domain S-box protein [Deltaproteobacteria bacterium]